MNSREDKRTVIIYFLDEKCKCKITVEEIYKKTVRNYKTWRKVMRQ